MKKRDTDDTGESSESSQQVETEDSDQPGERELVPVWLAAVVLVLLLAVMAVGGYIVGGVIGADTPETPEEFEIRRAQAEVEADPYNSQKVLELGWAYQQAGRYDEALVEYDRVIADSPLNTAAHYNKGVILLAKGDTEGAEEALWDVLEIEPAHVLAAKALGEHYAERGEYRSLLVAVRPAAEENESAADLQFLVGLAYENTGHADWAQVRYELALEYYPDMEKAKEGLRRLGVEQ
ncbi:MAG: tetratricopeptide repeat protein [Coriobacteriia bacterium]|nr:tetratricopeptide repeat protein [Coriobacteriia bacterium]